MAPYENSSGDTLTEVQVPPLAGMSPREASATLADAGVDLLLVTPWQEVQHGVIEGATRIPGRLVQANPDDVVDQTLPPEGSTLQQGEELRVYLYLPLPG